MSALEIFDYSGEQVRTVRIGQDIWFVAADVARVLGYSATAAMTRRIDTQDKGVRILHTLGGDQEMVIISEPGLFVAVLGSQVSGARDFQRWVTHELLPVLNRTGSYGQPSLPDFTQASAEVLAYIGTLAAATQAAVVTAQKNAGKAEAFDQWLNGKGCYSVGTVARMIGLGQQTLYNFLYAEKILIQHGARRREPLSKPQLRGWFEVKAFTQDRTNGHASIKTGVTPYGAEKIRLLAVERGLIQPQLLALTGGA